MNKNIKKIKLERDQIQWEETKNTRGLALIEVLVALTILLIIGGVSVNSFLNWRASKNIEVAADTVLSVLKEAKSLTQNGKGDYSYGVYFGYTDRAILFKGTSYEPGLVVSTTYLPSGMIISTSTLGTSVLFEKFSGNTNGNGTIIIKDNSNASSTRTVNIEATGSLSVK